jgi:hypothetical protein
MTVDPDRSSTNDPASAVPENDGVVSVVVVPPPVNWIVGVTGETVSRVTEEVAALDSLPAASLATNLNCQTPSGKLPAIEDGECTA